MRFAIVAALALSLCASAKPGHCRNRSCERGRGYYQTGTSGAVLFSWLTSSTTWDTAQELCDAVPVGKKTGNYWCQKGDGTMDSSGFSVVAKTGTFDTVARRHCPNGADCASRNAQYTRGAGYYTLTGSGALSIDTSFTACSYVSIANPAAQYNLLSRSTSGANWVFWLSTNASGGILLTVSNSGGALTSVTSSAVLSSILDRPSLICASYQAVGNGTSVGKVYLNGTQIATASNLPAPLGAGTNQPFTVGIENGDTSRRPFALVYNSAYVPSILSESEQQQILADMVGTSLIADVGTNPVYTASSPMACAYDADNVTIVPTIAPCIRNSSVEIWDANTNLLQRSQEINASPWTGATGSGYTSPSGMTARIGSAPSGAPNATSVDDGSGANFAGQQQAASTTTATKYTLSCYGKGAASSQSIHLALAGTGNTAGDNTCTTSLSTTNWTRATCTSTAAYGGGLTAITAKVAFGATAAATGTMYVWGCQLEEGDTASTLIVTTNASATRSAPTLSAAGPWAVASTPALAIDFTPGRLVQYQTPLFVYDSLTVGAIIKTDVNGNGPRYYADNAGPAYAAILVTPGTQYHMRGYTDGATNYLCLDGTCNSAAGSSASASYNTLDIGTGNSSLANACGLVKNVCLSNSETLCP